MFHVKHNPVVPIEDQISEITRELALRERVYPRLMAQGKMTESNADLHMARLRAVLATLMALNAYKRDPNRDMFAATS